MDISMLKDLVVLMKTLEEPQAPAAPAAPAEKPALATTVEGALRRFDSGALLGDLRVQTVPRGIDWRVHVGKNGKETLESPTVWRGIAHVGPHGRAWVSDLVDTKVPYVAATAADTDDFQAALAAAKAKTADATAAADADAEPTI